MPPSKPHPPVPRPLRRRAKRKRPKNAPPKSEHAEQAALIQWAGYAHFDGLRIGDHLFAIPNGAHLAGDGKDRAIKMARLKAEGLTPGVADLFLAVPICWGNTSHYLKAGLFIEMKAPDAPPSATTQAQRDFGERVRSVGYEWCEPRGFEAAQTCILNYLAGLPVGAD